MPAPHFLGLCSGLVLAQHPDDLLLAEATPFHRPSPFQATDSTSFRLSFRGAGHRLTDRRTPASFNATAADSRRRACSAPSTKMISTGMRRSLPAIWMRQRLCVGGIETWRKPETTVFRDGGKTAFTRTSSSRVSEPATLTGFSFGK